jgi:hypothetical protein
MLYFVVFPYLLKVFSYIIHAYPRAMLWLNADPSVQFALTTVNLIQNNPVYIDMLLRAYDPSYESQAEHISVAGLDQTLEDIRFIPASGSSSASGKGKGRADHPSEWIISWFSDYLSSIKDLDSHRLTHAPKDSPPSVDDLAFSESLATTMGFFMHTLQTRRFSEPFRAAIIDHGLKVSSD